MDFLSKKKEHIFLNNQLALVRVHVSKVAPTFNLWTEGRSKKYRDCIRELNIALKKFNSKDLPAIIIVANKKLGSGGISSYDHINDVIYYNNYYHTQERIIKIAHRDSFASQNLGDIIQHELGHKEHWDAAKKFYSTHSNKYNNLNEAKKELDSQLEKYIAMQDYTYLSSTVSPYAATSYRFSKIHQNENFINEVIAEYTVMGNTTDPNLNNLIEGVLKYANN